MQYGQRLSVVFFVFALTEDVYKKITHNSDPEAKCLDGSPAALYLHQGTQKDKFFIYFIGGGFCGVNTLSGTLEDCYERSKTRFGSSYLWSDTLSQEDGAGGILSLNQNLYKNWTKVLFTYCDGALHQGSNMNPIEYKDTKLYFRGNLIVRSHFKWLIENYKIDKASKIMLSGGSAGAVASTIWGNYLQSIVQDPEIVFNVPDCGVFLNVNTFKTNFPEVQVRIRNVMKLAYGEEQTPLSQCNSYYKGQEWKCTFLQYNYPFLKGKILFVQSQYDSWAITNILKIDCLKPNQSGSTMKYCSTQELTAIQNYRNQYVSLMNQKVKSQNRATWSIACSKHCYLSGIHGYNSTSNKIPASTGLSACDAVQEFVIKQKVNWSIDQKPWPLNQPCAF